MASRVANVDCVLLLAGLYKGALLALTGLQLYALLRSCFSALGESPVSVLSLSLQAQLIRLLSISRTSGMYRV